MTKYATSLFRLSHRLVAIFSAFSAFPAFPACNNSLQDVANFITIVTRKRVSTAKLQGTKTKSKTEPKTTISGKASKA